MSNIEETKNLQTHDNMEMRKKIVLFESVCLEMKDDHIDIPIQHYFSPGIYMRQMTMPKGSTVVGKIHKTEHLCILAKGHVIVVNENGREVFHAPAIIHATPGIKRVLHAYEESVWINIHHNPTNEKDIDKIDDIFVVNTYEQFLSFTENKQIEGDQ